MAEPGTPGELVEFMAKALVSDGVGRQGTRGRGRFRRRAGDGARTIAAA